MPQPKLSRHIARMGVGKYGAQPPVIYLREVDSGTPNECWVVCAKGDPGAIQFQPVQ
jgi:hypothetical protein